MRPSPSVSPAATTSPPLKSSTRTPWAGTPRPVSRTCVESDALISEESLRLSAVFGGDLRLFRADEASVPDDFLSAHVEAVDAGGGRQDERSERVVGTAELQLPRPPDGKVRALAPLQRADVVAAEHLGAAAGGQ